MGLHLTSYPKDRVLTQNISFGHPPGPDLNPWLLVWQVDALQTESTCLLTVFQIFIDIAFTILSSWQKKQRMIMMSDEWQIICIHFVKWNKPKLLWHFVNGYLDDMYTSLWGDLIFIIMIFRSIMHWSFAWIVFIDGKYDIQSRFLSSCDSSKKSCELNTFTQK